MKNPLKITCAFRTGTVRELNPCATQVCSYPFTRRGVSAEISVKDWAIEYHHKYAGKINFPAPEGINSLGREENMVHLYGPGCSFTEDTRQSEFPRQETYLLFRGGEFCGLNSLIEKKSHYCRFLDSERLIGDLLDKCAGVAFDLGENAFWEVQSLLSRCIYLFLNASKKTAENTYRISEKELSPSLFTRKAEEYMRENMSEALRNCDIAASLNLSESAFIHRFKRETGVSPKKRMLELKIETAKGLLYKGKRLKEISELTGFHDEFHLSKTFKKITGASPTNFLDRS